ncbi:hypothetical protein [Streptomyces sp. NPDC006739]|uniref:hypothetical protein n=1 Tax=Streptomyces sp. NPDC006739 TaxID=3364763 RepID=UPI0036C2145F
MSTERATPRPARGHADERRPHHAVDPKRRREPAERFRAAAAEGGSAEVSGGSAASLRSGTGH